MRRMPLLVCVFALLVPISALARTWHVPSETATIQAGLALAANGDTVLVRSGTYRGPGNRDIDFAGNAVTLRSESGDPRLCIIDCGGSGSEPHRGFRFASGESRESIVEGFTICNAYGSGVLCDSSSSPSVIDCIFTASSGSFGGGVSCNHGSSPLVTGCVFEGNRASAGGAMGCLYGSAPRISNCVFSDNITDGSFGGAFYCFRSSADITGCSFSRNKPSQAGGAVLCHQGVLTIADCDFAANAAGDSSHYGWGGAIAVGDHSTATIERCAFSGNQSNRGAAVACTDFSVVTMDQCRFEANVAQTGGALMVESDASLYAGGSTFLGNGATYSGGGVRSGARGYAEISSCVFSRNYSRWVGGAVTAEGGRLVIRDCTVYGNSGPGGGAVYADPISQVSVSKTLICQSIGEAVCCSNPAAVSLSCCDLYSNSGGDWVGCIAGQYGVSGNSTENPALCDTGADSECLELQDCSPCLNWQGCGAIGALGVGCACGGGPSGAVPTTWGSIKSMYK